MSALGWHFASYIYATSCCLLCWRGHLPRNVSRYSMYGQCQRRFYAGCRLFLCWRDVISESRVHSEVAAADAQRSLWQRDAVGQVLVVGDGAHSARQPWWWCWSDWCGQRSADCVGTAWRFYQARYSDPFLCYVFCNTVLHLDEAFSTITSFCNLRILYCAATAGIRFRLPDLAISATTSFCAS